MTKKTKPTNPVWSSRTIDFGAAKLLMAEAIRCSGAEPPRRAEPDEHRLGDGFVLRPTGIYRLSWSVNADAEDPQHLALLTDEERAALGLDGSPNATDQYGVHPDALAAVVPLPEDEVMFVARTFSIGLLDRLPVNVGAEMLWRERRAIAVALGHQQAGRLADWALAEGWVDAELHGELKVLAELQLTPRPADESTPMRNDRVRADCERLKAAGVPDFMKTLARAENVTERAIHNWVAESRERESPSPSQQTWIPR